MRNNTLILEDPIYGYMEFNNEVSKFINTPEFQRLRNLKQLGTLCYIYNSANHTRLEHSLGVSYLSNNLIKKFKNDHLELEITNLDINNVSIAGLMHDIGHGPYSHVFDNEFIPLIYPNINYKHENMSLTLIDTIIDNNNIDIESIDIKKIKNLINSTNKNNFIYEIVANSTNSIDVDKFDYLIRDMYYLLGYSKFHDFNKILKYNKIINNNICYDSRLSLDLYNLFQQRYIMHKQFYNHKIGKAVEYMISDILFYANGIYKIADSIFDPNEFIKYTDDIINTIKFNNDLNDPNLIKAKAIINRLDRREFYTFIDEYIVPNDKAKHLKINLIDIISYNNTNIKLNIDDIILFDKKINYNSKDKNPIDNVYFYDNNIKYKLKKDNISLLLPNIFEERILRIYSKINNKKINDAIQNCFQLYIKQFK